MFRQIKWRNVNFPTPQKKKATIAIELWQIFNRCPVTEANLEPLFPVYDRVHDTNQSLWHIVSTTENKRSIGRWRLMN